MKNKKRRYKGIKKDLKLCYLMILKKYYKFKILNRLGKKKKFKVVFFVLNLGMWKYDKLYKLMKKSNVFEPIIFICPFITYGNKIKDEVIAETYSYFKRKGYIVYKETKKQRVNIKKEINPDIIFFCTPWSHTYKDYLISNYLNCLTCYVSYSFSDSNNFSANYNKPLHNLVDIFFVETKFHQNNAIKNSRAKGKNTVVSGYPGIDSLIDPYYQYQNCWKPQNKRKKRIIWAPHHTIEGYQDRLNFSNFLRDHQTMLDIAEEYQNDVQFAFKPHPNLKGKLYDIWGAEKTNEYFNKWKLIPNGQLEEGEYMSLFLTSDALIHDSRSFIFEYLFTKKPSLFILSNNHIYNNLNILAKKALDISYKGNNQNDIKNFIKDIVIKGNDIKKNNRLRFYEKELKPPNNKLASENIYNYLVKNLLKK